MTHRLVGEVVPLHRMTSVQGQRLDVPTPGRLVHLQFRRFAGCALCNLHLRSFMRRYPELLNGGVQEIVVFQSTPGDVLINHATAPFPLVADPERVLYREFGVETSWRAMLHPHALLAALAGLLRFGAVLPTGDETALGLPADFLIAPDGRIVAVKYGTHGYDQWSVDEVLALAAVNRP